MSWLVCDEILGTLHTRAPTRHAQQAPLNHHWPPFTMPHLHILLGHGLSCFFIEHRFTALGKPAEQPAGRMKLPTGNGQCALATSEGFLFSVSVRSARTHQSTRLIKSPMQLQEDLQNSVLWGGSGESQIFQWYLTTHITLDWMFTLSQSWHLMYLCKKSTVTICWFVPSTDGIWSSMADLQRDGHHP